MPSKRVNLSAFSQREFIDGRESLPYTHFNATNLEISSDWLPDVRTLSRTRLVFPQRVQGGLFAYFAPANTREKSNPIFTQAPRAQNEAICNS